VLGPPRLRARAPTAHDRRYHTRRRAIPAAGRIGTATVGRANRAAGRGRRVQQVHEFAAPRKTCDGVGVALPMRFF
jgi:hypothetical protein